MLTPGMMTRKKFWVLFIGTLVFAGLGTFLAKKPSSGPQLRNKDLRPLPEDVDVALSRIRYTETRDGVARWTLDADTAELNFDAEETKIKNIQMAFFPDEEEPRVFLTARDGIVQSRSGEVLARGDVRLVWGGENHLSTERLKYRDSDRLILSEEPVKLVIGPSVIAGKGLRLSLDTLVLEIPANVQARFSLGPDADKRK